MADKKVKGKKSLEEQRIDNWGEAGKNRFDQRTHELQPQPGKPKDTVDPAELRLVKKGVLSKRKQRKAEAKAKASA